MEYNNTYHNIDTIISFKIKGEIKENEYSKVIKIIDYYFKKIVTTYDLVNTIIKLSKLFHLFKDNLIVINFNNEDDNFSLRYQNNKLIYYYKSKVINNKLIEIKYQNKRFRIIEPNPNFYEKGHEEKDYKEVASTILNEIETYESLKELTNRVVEIDDELKEFYGLYTLFFNEKPSLDSNIYLKATCMYFIIEYILEMALKDNYYLKDNIVVNTDIDMLVYNYLELINIEDLSYEVDKRVGTIGYKIRQYFNGNLTSYLYNRDLNKEENIEFENLISDIHYNLESYKRNVKRKKYLTRFS